MPNHVHGLISINPPVGAPLVGAQDAAPVGAQDAAHAEKTTRHTDPRATTRVAPTANHDVAEPGEATEGNSARAATRSAPTPDRWYALGEIVGAFKSLTTVAYIRRVKTRRWPPFTGKLWQRNYFEHVVRSEESLDKIRQYISENPARWEFDKENPMAVRAGPRCALTISTDSDPEPGPFARVSGAGPSLFRLGRARPPIRFLFRSGCSPPSIRHVWHSAP